MTRPLMIPACRFSERLTEEKISTCPTEEEEEQQEEQQSRKSQREKHCSERFKLADSSQTLSSRSRNACPGLIFVIVVVVVTDMLIFSLQ